MQLNQCVACFPACHVTGKSFRSASCNLHIDLYVTNVEHKVLSNCSQNNVIYYRTNVRDRELFVILYIYIYIYKKPNDGFIMELKYIAMFKIKAVTLQPWRGPEDSRSLKLPDFKRVDT